jgi:hypothetical protein
LRSNQEKYAREKNQRFQKKELITKNRRRRLSSATKCPASGHNNRNNHTHKTNCFPKDFHHKAFHEERRVRSIDICDGGPEFSDTIASTDVRATDDQPGKKLGICSLVVLRLKWVWRRNVLILDNDGEDNSVDGKRFAK